MAKGSRKRPDIQTYRCLAICSVLAFHLQPTLFPLGYLGVDIFFVLSGYLMSMMLAREDKLHTMAIVNFYWRRIARILPIYSVVVFGVAVLSRFILAPIDYSTLVRDTYYSLVFAANIEQYRDGSDYWAQVNDSPILLHLWSLGAEVQYYVIVPVIGILQGCFRKSDHQLIFLAIMTFASFASFSFATERAAFLLMFNRIWQFLMGSIAFQTSIEDDVVDDCEALISKGKESQRELSSRALTMIFIVISFICFSPVQVPIRLTVSIFTGCMLMYGSQGDISLLSNRCAVKFGNASYVLYLVHWPVITLWKYYFQLKSLDALGVSVCFTISVLLSIILHEFVELKMLLISKKSIIVFVIVFYAATLAVTSIPLQYNLSAADRRYNYTEVVKWNTKGISRNGKGKCSFDKEGAQWVAPYKDEPNGRCFAKGNGTARILLLGNSFAYVAHRFLIPLLQPIAKEIRLFDHHGCRILINGSCPPFSKAWPKMIEKMNPDVTWIISREPELTTAPLIQPLEDDPTFLYARDTLDFISNHSKFVVLDYQGVGIAVNKTLFPPKTINRRISEGKFYFDDLKVTKEEWEMFDRNETVRMNGIKIPNLIAHNYADTQCKGGNCYYFNPANLHVYFADNYAHATTEFFDLLEPSYLNIIQKLKELLKL